MTRKARDIIVRPVVSEKSYGNVASNKFTFIVDLHATKVEIRKAVEEIWGVRVLSVNTLKRRGKPVRMKNWQFTHRSDERRAIVTLAEGDTIEVFEGV